MGTFRKAPVPLALRSTQAARGESDRVRSAQECVAENGQQKRSRRCTEAEPSAARGTTHAGVPRRVGGAHLMWGPGQPLDEDVWATREYFETTYTFGQNTQPTL